MHGGVAFASRPCFCRSGVSCCWSTAFASTSASDSAPLSIAPPRPSFESPRDIARFGPTAPVDARRISPPFGLATLLASSAELRRLLSVPIRASVGEVVERLGPSWRSVRARLYWPRTWRRQ